MIPDAQGASAQIADIEAVRRAVRQSNFYRLASVIVILWGGVTAVGNLASHAWPHSAGSIWICLDVIGVLATSALGLNIRGRGYPRAFDWRTPVAFALFFGFGFLWSMGLGRFGPRELSVFWPTPFMFGYAVAGLWLGAAFVVLGVGVAGLVTLGYFFGGPWLDIYLAPFNGGGLVAAGLWMRRA